jgi:hypothetical protein
MFNQYTDGEQIFNQYLSPGEKLLWFGLPQKGLQFVPLQGRQIGVAFFVSLIIILWFGIIIKVLVDSNFHDLLALFLAIVGSPLFFVLYRVIFGRSFTEQKIRENSAYGLTNQKLIIILNMPETSVILVNLATIKDISIKMQPYGYGDIHISSSSPVSGKYTSALFLKPGHVCLKSVSDAINIKKLIKDVIEKTRN